MVKSLKTLYNKYSYTIIALYYFVILVWFSHLKNVIVPKYFMYTWLDSYIPFISWMIIPYYLWFAYIAVTMVYFGLKFKSPFIKLSIHMFVGMTICLILYMLFPNTESLRPHLVNHDFFTNLVRDLYAYDNPNECAPSIHVLNAIAVHLSIFSNKELKYRKFIVPASFILMVLIIFSTVCLKQHSVLDVIYGALLSLVLYLFIYKFNFKSFRSYWEKLFNTGNKIDC